MKRKILSCLVCAAMVASMVVGCGSSSTSSDTAETSTTEATTEAETATESTGDAIEITLASFHVDGTSSFYPVAQSMIDSFNEDYAGQYVIVHDNLPSDSHNTNTAAMAAADALPDMVYLKGSQTRDYGEMGLIIDMADLLEESGILDELKDGATMEHTVGDAIYAMPTTQSTYGYIYYNTEIFEEVGIEEFPTTIDELLVAAEKISDAGYIPMAMGDKDLWPADSITFSAFVTQFVGLDWIDSIKAMDGEANFSDQEFINALTAFQTLGTSGLFNDNLSSLTNDEALQLYMNGDAAMKSGGDWENVTITNSAPEIAEVTDIAAWPGPSEGAVGDPAIEISCTWGVAIGSNTAEEKIEGIMIFLDDYFTTDEIAQMSIDVAANNVSWESNADLASFPELSQEVIAASESVDACSNWDSILSTNVKTEYQRGLQEILLGMTTPEELAADMQEAFESDM